MRSMPVVLFFIAITFICWGLYGPVLHEGQEGLGIPGRPSSLRPIICVGVAYFLIAVLVPLISLWTKGEKGRWTMTGAFWSFMAGAAGAIGALGITLAFKFGGKPIFVMPLVFGLAPVMNTFVTMWMTKTFRQASPLFFSGVIIVATGAAGVMFFKPAKPHAPPAAATEAVAETTVAATASESPDTRSNSGVLSSLLSIALVPLFIGLTAVCWGSYGPVLHKGQMKMDGSRLRPFLCVGLAYFVIAVVVPIPLLRVFDEVGGWTMGGVIWSMAGGAAGAIGALGIIMAFNFGGKPIYVMPLVFGGAPVINTLTTILHEGTYAETTPFFFASLLLVIGGAVTVLIFAPRGHAPEKSHGGKEKSSPKAKPKSEPEESKPQDKAPAKPTPVAKLDEEAGEETMTERDEAEDTIQPE